MSAHVSANAGIAIKVMQRPAIARLIFISGQKMKALFLIVASSVILIACGGGGGSSNAPAVQQANPAVQKSVIINVQGDSTIWGVTYQSGAYVRASPTVVESMHDDLVAAMGPDYLIAAYNYGVINSTLCEDMNGTVLFGTPLATRLASDPSKVVMENFGLNDGNPTNPGYVSPTQFQQCLEAFVDTVRAAGKMPVLEQPNPPSLTQSQGMQEGVANIAAVVTAVGQEKGVPVIDQYDYIKTLPGWSDMLSDGVHPTRALYAIKAQREAAVLQRVLASLP
jgi:acyl-CoA thioesterase-1